MRLTFRAATEHDAKFVALIMMEAVGMGIMEKGEDPAQYLIDICLCDDTLYSWKNATIVEADGTAIGGLISYCGEGYHEVKQHTFSMVKDHLMFDADTMDDETRAGEYYLDSAAVLPSHRGKGVGRQIINYGIEQARKRGLTAVLACDPENANALHLYKSLGFKEDGTMHIFGEDYLRMTCSQL